MASLGQNSLSTATLELDPRVFARPALMPPVSEWAEETMRFDPAVDVSPRYVIAKAPYARAVFEWWADKNIEEIFLLMPTQAGKTAMINTLIGYCIANDPGPCMFVQADETNVKAFVQKRLKPALRKTFPKLVSENPRDDKWTEDKGAVIGGLDLWIAWATSESRLRSWPRRYIFGDETSLWKHPRSLAWERTKQFQRNRKGLWATTPTVEDEESWQAATGLYQLHRWWVPCPHCGAFQILDFERIQFKDCKGANGWDLDRVEAEAWYQCLHCDGRIENHHRQEMLEAGEARTEHPERSRKRVSLRITAHDVPNMTWGGIARKFLESKDAPDDLRTFVNGWLVKPWKPDIKVVAAEEILKRSVGTPEGTAPADTAFLIGTIDVQQHHVWAAVYAFQKDRRVTLVRARRVDGEGSTPRALERAWDEVMAVEYPVAGESEPRRVSVVGVDSGYATDDVYLFCMKHAGCIPLKGRDSDSLTNSWTSSHIDRYANGKPIPGGLRLYIVSTARWREHVLLSHTRPLDEPGAWLVHENCSPEYAQHLTSWTKRVVKLKDGRTREEWFQAKPDDHLLDDAIYAACIFEIMGGRKLELSGEQDRHKPRRPASVTGIGSIRRNY